LILENGVIRTLEPAMPSARALAIAGERIAGGVGVHETALASPDVVDLGGRCVLPGFNDAHVHFPTWSLAQRQVRLEGARSLDETLERAAAAAREVPPGQWLRGHGWRSGDWEPAIEPTKEVLDRVTGDTPAALMARDYHSRWLNSAALARANGELEVAGGVVVRDERGEPTGVLREECAWHFRDAHVHPSQDEMVEASREGVELANSRGVTAVHDKDGWLGALGVFQRLQSEGSLTLRVWESHPKDDLDDLLALPLHGAFGNEFLRLGYVKAFMDGTLGSQTARMLDGTGVEITSRAELEETILRAASRGLPVAVHAIGDRANRDALDAFESTRATWAPLRLRPRIEHAQLLAPEDVPRFGRLGVAASVQFSHAPSDRDLADRFWAGQTDGAYAYRSLLETGALLANGSDAPIEELDPWAGVCAGVLRRIDDRAAWHPEQCVTLQQALEATCIAPPWLAGDYRRRGKLIPGFDADLVVLDRDPFGVEPEELPEIEVVATMVAGRWVHNPPPWQ
jgi:predicted amidohydrolase YtcJ